MVNDEFSRAYTEVIEILKYVPKEDVAKIPDEKIAFYKKYMAKDYEYTIDENLEFDKQAVSEIAKAILANIFRDYWATQMQRVKILEKENYDLENIEREKREKYPPNNVFKVHDIYENTGFQEKSLTEAKKESFFTKLINFFKKRKAA